MPEPIPEEAIGARCETVGQRIRAARQARCWTQAELASRLSCTQTAISYWESGQRGMDVDDLLELARALDVAPGRLLGDDAGFEAGFQAGIAASRLALERIGEAHA